MKKTRKQAALIAAAVATTGAIFASQASAAFTFDWTAANPSIKSYPDNTADAGGLKAGRDITNVWFGVDSDRNSYFRVDLAGTPSGNTKDNSSAQFAANYGIYFNVDQKASGKTYNELSGIDKALTVSVVKFKPNNKTDTGLIWKKDTSNFDFQATGTTLEWKLTKGQFDALAKGLTLDPSGKYQWYAATRTSAATNGTTYDVGASNSVTPIPGAAWLLGSGIFGLVGLKRRSKAAA